MYPVSDRFLRQVANSGKRKTVADVYYDGILAISDLPISEGQIRVDLEGNIRRSGSLTIADPALVPTLNSALSPLGAEVQIRHGVIYPDGTEELIPMGVFRLDVTTWKNNNGVPSIQLYDRSKTVSVDLPSTHSRSGWMAKDVIVDFIEWFIPSIVPINPTEVFDPSLGDYRLPGGHSFSEGDHWDAIVSLARNLGGRLYFDVTGFPKCDPIVELSADSVPVWTISAGDRGTLVEANQTYSREGVYNAVSVIGAASEGGKIPKYTAYNSDPSSPLRYAGPFGRVGTVISDGSLTTQARCAARAQAELVKYTGLGYSLDFTAVPNPALDVGDIVEFLFPDGTSQIHQIASLTIPLGAGTYTGSSKGLYLG